VPERYKQVVRNHPNAEERRIRRKLTAQHALHAKVEFALLDLGGINVQRVRGRAGLADTGGDDVPVDAIKAAQPRARTGTTQPVADGIGAGQGVVFEQGGQRGV